MPKDFASEELRKVSVTELGIKSYFRKRDFSAKYLRKWNYNFLILNGIPESVADFIQGRALITVGSMPFKTYIRGNPNIT